MTNLLLSQNKLKALFFIMEVPEIAVSQIRKVLSIFCIYLSFCRTTFLKPFKVFKEFPVKTNNGYLPNLLTLSCNNYEL